MGTFVQSVHKPFITSNIKSSGKRFMFRLTACFPSGSNGPLIIRESGKDPVACIWGREDFFGRFKQVQASLLSVVYIFIVRSPYIRSKGSGRQPALCKMEHDDTTTSLYINIKSRKHFYNLIFLSFILYHQIVRSLPEIDSSLWKDIAIIIVI